MLLKAVTDTNHLKWPELLAHWVTWFAFLPYFSSLRISYNIFFFFFFFIRLCSRHFEIFRWSLDELHSETELQRWLKQLLVFANVGGFFFSRYRVGAARDSQNLHCVWDEYERKYEEISAEFAHLHESKRGFGLFLGLRIDFRRIFFFVRLLTMGRMLWTQIHTVSFACAKQTFPSCR